MEIENLINIFNFLHRALLTGFMVVVYEVAQVARCVGTVKKKNSCFVLKAINNVSNKRGTQ